MSNACESNKVNVVKEPVKVANIETKEATSADTLMSSADKVSIVYDDIMETLGIDFIPNMYKAMESNPDYLELTWKKVQAIMNKMGKLDKKTRDIIAFTVSIMSGSSYCIDVYNQAMLHNGLDKEAITEIYAIIDIYTGLNRFNIANRTEKDVKPWYGCS